MRKAMWLGICALALGLGVSTASADVVTIAVTGHVTQVNDSSLGVTVGQAVTGTYSYDPSTPASSGSSSSSSTYVFTSPPASMNVAVTGGPTYQTQSGWTFQATVTSPPSQPLPIFNYAATSPSSNGSATTVSVVYTDYFSVWLSPPSLPATAPPASVVAGTAPNFPPGISVRPAGSSGFDARIDSATLIPSITISPANSSFITQQNFDAVLLLSEQLSVTSMRATVGSARAPVGFSYPGTCQLAAANNAQRTALICPNAATALAGLGGGPVTIDWLITLADGSTLQQSVVWNLVL